MIRSREDQIDGDVFEVLASLGDFQAFKELMLSFKNVCDILILKYPVVEAALS